MIEKFVTSPSLADNGPSEQSGSRLADRLAMMAPASPVVAAFDGPPPPPRDFAPEVRVVPAEAKAAAAGPLTLRPPHHAPAFDIVPAATARKRHSRSIVGSLVAAYSFIPYTLVALFLRLVMARVLFLDGQARIDGPHLHYSFHGLNLSVILPMQVKAPFAFLGQHAALQAPGAFAGNLAGYAEFVLPIMLVLGFGTRIAALGLLIMTAMIQVLVLPDALWTTHVYWVSLLLVLLSLGPGKVSIDHVIRWLSGRRKTGGTVS